MEKRYSTHSRKRFPTTLAEQARVFGYERFLSENGWEITIAPPRNVRRLWLGAIYLASAEGAPMHAQALEARLPHLHPDFKFKAGRLANGCQTCYVGP